MKIAAIIAEYNPFHNGHGYQISKVKEQLNCDYIIVIMSGEFTQRGIPAICNKSIRTQIALEHGVDVVLELPLLFSTGSAEIFSKGAVGILNALNCIDYLAYGTEQLTETDTFKKAVTVLSNESEEFKNTLRENLSNGFSYPAALEKAVLAVTDELNCPCTPNELTPEVTECSNNSFDNLFLPNNLLAMEYEKQLYKTNSPITGKNIHRIGKGYSDISLDDNFVSASALRNYIKDNIDTPEFAPINYMPPKASAILTEHFKNYAPVFEDDFSYVLYSRLHSEFSDTINNLKCNYLDCNELLANKIRKNLGEFYSFSQFTSRLKSKEFTYNRISRSLCHIMLGITTDMWQMAKESDDCLYARLLGFNKNASPLLKQLKENSSIPIISKTANAVKSLNKNALAVFNQSINASNLYHGVCRIKSGQKTKNEFQYNIIIKD